MRRLAVLLLSLILCRCASIEGGRQNVGVITESPGVEVFQGEQSLGRTPLIVNLEREHRSNLLLRTGTKSERVDLKGQYRWGKAFWSNFIFLTAAPIAWFVDLGTGSAFEFPTLVHSNFNATGPIPKEDEIRVAIAPPLTIHGDVADELGQKLVAILQAQLGSHYEVIDYSKTRDRFSWGGGR